LFFKIHNKNSTYRFQNISLQIKLLPFFKNPPTLATELYLKKMKIQFFGGNTFQVSGKEAKMVFDPGENTKIKEVDFITNSGRGDSTSIKEFKKELTLPGEFEISEVLIMGYYSSEENIVYKVVLEDISFVHFGNLKEVPKTKFFDKLGEHVDVIFVCLDEEFNEKKAKELIETIEPRMAILGGNVSLFPSMVEIAGAKNLEDNPMKLSKSQLSDDKTEIIILPN